MRPCPYCSGQNCTPFGDRLGAVFLRCVGCGSIHRDLTYDAYARLHEDAFSDEGFVANIVDDKALIPDRSTWAEFEDLLPDGPLLEIGPGTGHFLAAAREAGREVYAVEASAIHREFVRDAWHIDTIFGSLEELPPAPRSFASVVMFNTIEHVFDVAQLFRDIRARLGTGGALLVSTCNAECIILPVVGVYWSMFKQPDHVSIPSAGGFRRLATRTGLTCERVWTGELPLETPIGLATAARDYVLERRRSGVAYGGRGGSHANGADASSEGRTRLRRVVRGAMRLSARVDPTRHLTALVGRAAAVRGLFRRNDFC